MTMLTARVEQARITITIDFKPCPFCGSEDISIINGFGESSQEIDFVDCAGCAASAPAEVWNHAPRPEIGRRRKPSRFPLF